VNAEKSIVSSDISYMIAGNTQMWSEIAATPLGKLRLADAYLGRITVGAWETRRMMMDELKGMIGGLVRECDPAAILGDPHVRGMIRHLYGEAGVTRLKRRVEENALRQTSGQ
jgi:hypothetical protein